MTETTSTSEDVFTSSDSVRTNTPLKYQKTFRMSEPFSLEQGGSLPEVEIGYETYGQLNAAKDNAVLICHAISGDSHVARHTDDDTPGWWEIMVGPGRPIDTERYFVICSHILGGCRGSTGPSSLNPQTGKRYAADFPLITIADMVRAQRELLRHLEIERLLCIVGGSLGGHQALTWSTLFPECLRGCVAMATSPRLTSQALAFDVVGRNAIIRDPHYHGGQYYDQPTKPEVGLALARMLGHITYLSPESMQQKFDRNRFQPRQLQTAFEAKFSVGSYLAYQGHKFVERFDANSYIVLSMAMDQFDLGDSHEKLRQNLGKSQCRWMVISFTSDWLFPPSQSQQMVDALIAEQKPVSYVNVESPCGHDAFLLEDNFEVYGNLVASFLDNLADEAPDEESHPMAAPLPELSPMPTNIFQDQRLDYDLILELIKPGSSVLDLGCGSGELLSRLRKKGHTRLVGIEIDEHNIVASVNKGFDVIQADLNKGLCSFKDEQFDVVVLSQTLPSILDTRGIIDEMLRVGRLGIVSFPNFAHRPMREMFYHEGRSPRSTGLFDYPWYETPNRRFASIRDFDEFCHQQGITIHHSIFLDTEANQQVTDDPNLSANVGIFAISRS